MVGNFINALLWLKICKYKILIVKGRQQEHEANPSKFPQDGVKSHEDALLYLMTYSWEKCELLGLDDQKKVLDDISEEVGFESGQSNNEGQNEGSFLEEIQKEIHDEAFEGTSYDDIESIEYSSIQNEQHNRDHDLLSNLIDDNPIIDDY